MMTGPTDTGGDSSLGRPDDPAYYEALGRAIRVLRTERGMERKDLAAAAGMSYAYLSEIETGKKRPSSKALFVIAEALGVRPAELLALGDRYERATSASPAPARAAAPRPSVHSPAPPAATAPAASPPQEPGPGRWRWFERGTSEPSIPLQRALATETVAAPASERPPETHGELIEQLRETASRLTDEDLAALVGLARRLGR